MSLLGIVGASLGLYKIVPIDEAHVRIQGNSRKVFMAGMYKGKECKSSYWKIPGITRITKLPLSNIRIDVPDTKLNDSDMAKFMCDLVCFVHITDPLLAAERTGLTTEKIRYEGGFKQISEDFRAIMESVGRTTAAKQKILDIYKDRSKLFAFGIPTSINLATYIFFVLGIYGFTLISLRLRRNAMLNRNNEG